MGFEVPWWAEICLCLCCCYSPSELYSIATADCRQAARRRQRLQPQEPVKRSPTTRRLTLGTITSSTPNPAQSASILSLPAELKAVIYAHVFGPARAVSLQPPASTSISSNQQHPQHLIKRTHGILALPLTCRQLYTETSPILYSYRRFATQRPMKGPSRQLAAFLSRMPQHHISWITNIQVSLSHSGDPLSGRRAYKAWVKSWMWLARELKDVQRITVRLDREYPTTVGDPVGYDPEAMFEPSKGGSDFVRWLAPSLRMPMPVTLQLKFPQYSRFPLAVDLEQIKARAAAQDLGAVPTNAQKSLKLRGDLDAFTRRACRLVSEDFRRQIDSLDQIRHDKSICPHTSSDLGDQTFWLDEGVDCNDRLRARNLGQAVGKYRAGPYDTHSVTEVPEVNGERWDRYNRQCDCGETWYVEV